MESSRAEDSLCGSDCDVNEEIDAAPMDIGSDGFDGEIHDDVSSILPSIYMIYHNLTWDVSISHCSYMSYLKVVLRRKREGRAM